MRVCDEDFYWFITFRTDEPGTDPEILKALGVEEPESTMNLWPCRHCGAMVAGGLRNEHRKFHRNG